MSNTAKIRNEAETDIKYDEHSRRGVGVDIKYGELLRRGMGLMSKTANIRDDAWE